MDLNQVKPGLLGQHGRLAKGFGDGFYLFGGQAGDVGARLLVEQAAQLIGADPLGEKAGQVFQHGFQVGIRLMELGADEAALPVDHLGQMLVPLKALAGVKAGAKAAPAHRHIPQDDEGTAPGGDAAQPLLLLLGRYAQAGGGEDDPVF